jgi:hypothetical protein
MRFAATLANLPGNCFAALESATRDYDFSPLPGQQPGGCLADTTARARHQRDPTGEIEQVGFLCCHFPVPV